MLQKMSFLRNAIKSNGLIRPAHQNQGVTSFIRKWPRALSTDVENPSRDPLPLGPFLHPISGPLYARLFGITKHTSRSDVINMLDGSNLTLDDLKVDWDRSYTRASMMVQFPSKNDYDAALKIIARNRLYRLERADRAMWDYLTPFNGKAILLQGIPRNAVPDDIDRFLSGTQYDASTIHIFTRQGNPEPTRMAVAHFPSARLAMNAFLAKNKEFCLNNQIIIRVLH